MGTKHARRADRGAAGFSLMEAIVATVISVIAVIALAYSFGYGRSFITSFGTRRAADGVAQGCMERLGTLPAASPELAMGPHPATPVPFVCDGRTVGTMSWMVTEPTDVPISVHNRLREVTVTVNWAQGGLNDAVEYTRLVAAP